MSNLLLISLRKVMAMFEPELYRTAHKSLKSIDGELIKKHFDKVIWRQLGCHTYMDIGSGSGDLFMNSIYSILKDKFEKFICSDISPVMLEYFKNYYKTPSTFEYLTLDITTKEGVPNDRRGTIDYLSAINILPMIHDYNSTLKNIYELLRSNGGECLFVFMPKTTIFEAYEQLSKTSKWLDYKTAIERAIPPMFYWNEPKEVFENLMINAGFKEITIETRTEYCCYENYQDIRDSLKSTCLPINCMPTPDAKNEFLNDLVDTISSLVLKSTNGQQMDSEFFIKFYFMSVSAKRI